MYKVKKIGFSEEKNLCHLLSLSTYPNSVGDKEKHLLKYRQVVEISNAEKIGVLSIRAYLYEAYSRARHLETFLC